MKEEFLVISNANKKPHSKNHATVVLKPNSKNLKNATKIHSSNKNPMKCLILVRGNLINDSWQEAINGEMDSLESNRTWHLVDLPPRCKTIGCKWILKRKLKADGTVDKFKASVKLFKNTGDSVRQTKYASIIGSLRYATDCTRPNIAYAVGVLCRFTSNPNVEHWRAIERVMRYLMKTINFGLCYEKLPAILEGYSDADWNIFSEDSKATNGYVFNIVGTAVSWKSKKQTILAQSTMESEIIALATASEEA
ncbi:secreted RxLR effector protein 161-like [Malus sylvestris]|uniref:secreted RxLR effector protein 161-like n=1 Tax=Malus sylvestris TaxID=3752 RepID=UPI0021AC35EA|nr:secreted RxLR effector protein 161-like [Malus sylvestris]